MVYEDEDNAGNMDQDESRTVSRSGAFFVMFIWYFFIIWYLCENVGKLVLRNNIGNMHKDNHEIMMMIIFEDFIEDKRGKIP